MHDITPGSSAVFQVNLDLWCSGVIYKASVWREGLERRQAITSESNSPALHSSEKEMVFLFHYWFVGSNWLIVLLQLMVLQEIFFPISYFIAFWVYISKENNGIKFIVEFNSSHRKERFDLLLNKKKFV